MAKLSNKAATEIASLFNSVAVAESFIEQHAQAFGAGRITPEEWEQKYRIWQASKVNAAIKLRDNYGIKVIGVTLP